jgi:hypothetical protein
MLVHCSHRATSVCALYLNLGPKLVQTVYDWARGKLNFGEVDSISTLGPLQIPDYRALYTQVSPVSSVTSHFGEV